MHLSSPGGSNASTVRTFPRALLLAGTSRSSSWALWPTNSMAPTGPTSTGLGAYKGPASLLPQGASPSAPPLCLPPPLPAALPRALAPPSSRPSSTSCTCWTSGAHKHPHPIINGECALVTHPWAPALYMYHSAPLWPCKLGQGHVDSLCGHGTKTRALGWGIT